MVEAFKNMQTNGEKNDRTLFDSYKKSEVRTRLNLTSIAKELENRIGVDFFRYVRATYLSNLGFVQKPQKDEVFELLLRKIASDLAEKPENLWGSQKFQMLFRATHAEDLEVLGLEFGKQVVDEVRKVIVEAKRQMSILPYNAIMPQTTVKKFIPSRSDRYSGKWRHSMDPYGIWEEGGKVKAVDENGNVVYLATRKFPYAVLANITESCPVGCDGCYKGSMVRTALAALSDIYPEFAEIKKQLSLEEKRAVKQTELLVRWLNKHPEVDTVVISGGEPLLYSNSTVKKMLELYKLAKHVKVVRICTSAIFQGLWYRIDDELVQTLKDFEKTSGKQFLFNAHVTDEFQLTSPESKMAVEKLQTAGITIHLQMPIQEGINFFREDIGKTVLKLKTISREAYGIDVDPYKMIVDMHSPSSADLTVPIETVTKAIAFLDQHNSSDHERWKAYNILHEQGNLYLSAYPLWTAVKEVDREAGRVTYFIPKVQFNDGGSKEISVHTYSEPLIIGQNDDPDSLNPIADKDVMAKISQIKNTYHILRAKVKLLEESEMTYQQKAKAIEKIEKDYYKLSGITFPVNEPLKLSEEDRKEAAELGMFPGV